MGLGVVVGGEDGVRGELGGLWVGGLGGVGEFAMLSCIYWKKLIVACVMWTAITCYAASCHVHRRPPVSRSAYVSWAAVAAVDLDGEIYGPVPAAVIFDDPADAGTRLGGVSGRFIRRG